MPTAENTDKPVQTKTGSIRRDLAIAIAAGLIYWLLCEASVEIAGRHPPYPVWLSEGFALGLWLIAPARSRWLQLTAVFAANMASTLLQGVAPSLANAIAGSAVNVFQLAASGWLLEIARQRFLASGNTLTLFVALLAGPVGAINAVSAYASALVFHYRGGIAISEAFATVFISDGLGVLLVTPLLVSWADRIGRKELVAHPKSKVEAFFVLTAVAGVSWWVFSLRPDAFGVVPPVFYLGIPFVLWAALRLGLRGATVALALHSLLAFYFTLRDLGPFSAGFIPSSRSVLQLQGYLGVLIVTTLLAGVLMRERRTASQSALAWRLRYEAALKVSASVVYEIRPNRDRIVWAGDTLDALGIPPEELSTIGAWTARIHADDRARMVGLRKKLLEGEIPSVELTCRLRHAADAYITVGVTAYGVDAPERSLDLGEAEGRRIIGFVKDITEKIRAQEERNRLEGELRQAQKMEAIGQLAGGIAHDFSNILASILGYGEMARNRAAARVDADSALVRQIDTILQAGERGRDLVSQILTFSRKSPAQTQTLDLRGIIDEVVHLLRGSNPHEIVFRMKPMSDPPNVLGNATELHQLFMNLAINGLQAMPDGGVLEIDCSQVVLTQPRTVSQQRLAPGPYLQICITDHGTGIDDATRQRMFEPFFTTKGLGQGTGLGLSLAMSVAKAHGGGIDLESAPGCGARFMVYLPADQASVNSRDEPSKVPRGHDERILLVDDEPDLLRLAEELLIELGYQVAGFGNSVEALAAFERNPGQFDAVLTDEVMPEMTGTQLVRRIHAIAPALPTLIITGYGGAGFELRAQQAGVISVLKKPYQLAELARALDRALRTPMPSRLG